jgi:hypothetical protein
MQPYTFLVAAASVDNRRERAADNAWTTPQIYRSCSATWVASWIYNYILGRLSSCSALEVASSTPWPQPRPPGGDSVYAVPSPCDSPKWALSLPPSLTGNGAAEPTRERSHQPTKERSHRANKGTQPPSQTRNGAAESTRERSHQPTRERSHQAKPGTEPRSQRRKGATDQQGNGATEPSRKRSRGANKGQIWPKITTGEIIKKNTLNTGGKQQARG